MKICPYCSRTYSDTTPVCAFCHVALKGSQQIPAESWRTIVIEALMSFACVSLLEDATIQEYYGNALALLTSGQKEALCREAIIVRMYVIRVLCLGRKIPRLVCEAFALGLYTSLPLFNKDFSVDQYSARIQQRYKEYDEIFKNLKSLDDNRNRAVYEQFCVRAFQNTCGHKPQTDQDLVLSTLFMFLYTNTCEVISRRLHEWFSSGLIVLDT